MSEIQSIQNHFIVNKGTRRSIDKGRNASYSQKGTRRICARPNEEWAHLMSKRNFPLFAQLLTSYPDENLPCNQGWSNQCAIRMSISLIGAGFNLTDYTDPLCNHGHARGAESLANYLWKQTGPPFISVPATQGKSLTLNKTGIILFKDISGFRGGIGDHIDLWNSNGTITGEYFDESNQTWFWHII